MSKEQSTFVPGRSIIDNALVVSKILHYLKCKRNGRKRDVVLKIDISKAYDCIDWGYLHAMLI